MCVGVFILGIVYVGVLLFIVFVVLVVFEFVDDYVVLFVELIIIGEEINIMLSVELVEEVLFEELFEVEELEFE